MSRAATSKAIEDKAKAMKAGNPSGRRKSMRLKAQAVLKGKMEVPRGNN